MPRMKSSFALVLCLLLLGTASACGKGGDGPKAPEAYTIGEESAPPLDDKIEETGQLESVEEEPVEDAQGEAGGKTVYTYKDLPSGGETTKSYAEELEGQGFQVVNETGEPAQAPDYQAESGSVYLAKNAESQQGYRFQIGLDWTEAGCVVTVEMLQGSVGQEQEPWPKQWSISKVYRQNCWGWRAHPWKSTACIPSKALFWWMGALACGYRPTSTLQKAPISWRGST